MKEQKIVLFKMESVDFIGDQLKVLIDKYSIDGWYVHQVVPTHQQEYLSGNLRLQAAIVILQRDKNEFDYET